jgi:hypothetical protein
MLILFAVLVFCHSFMAEKGRVPTSAVEINSLVVSSTSDSRKLYTAFSGAGSENQIRAAVASTAWIDVSFRVLAGSDWSAVELGIFFSNLINGGILSDQLSRAVSTTKADAMPVLAERKSWYSFVGRAAHISYAHTITTR